MLVRKLLLVSLVVCVFSACNSAAKNPSPGVLGTERQAAVSFGTNGLPVVSPDPLHLRVHQDKAVWLGENELRIDLPAGHDQPTCNHTGPQWRCTSKTFSTVGNVKYSVSMKDASGAWKTQDPMLDIEP